MKKTLSVVWNNLPTPIQRVLRRAGAYRLVRQVTGPVYEPDVQRFIAAMVKPGWVCADVGANIGSMTWTLASQVGPTGHVFAFEPHPENVMALNQNMRDLGMSDRVTVEAVAVSDGEKPNVTLFPGQGRMSPVWNIVGHDTAGNVTEPECEVPAIALDNYFLTDAQGEAALSRLNLVKIDVEGAGALVLKGMRRLIRERRPFFIIEFHDPEEWQGRETLTGAGYVLYDLLTRAPATSQEWTANCHIVAAPPGSLAPLVW